MIHKHSKTKQIQMQEILVNAFWIFLVVEKPFENYWSAGIIIPNIWKN